MNSPSIPDPSKAAIQGSLSDLANYPFQTQINALSQMGGKATINGKNYDFTGLGNADQNNAVSSQMAQALLDIQKNYGPQYVQQRLADLKQSDPTGYAARAQMFNSILADAQKSPDNTMSNGVQDQITSLLGQGSNLSTGPGSETEAVQQGVRGQQVKGGIFLGNAPVSQEASALVNAGDQQQQQRQQQALGFLNSGVSPQDVTYRRIQQSLSNLGNAINGTTPEAQFSSLAGAGNGAAPFNPGNVATTSLNPNAGLNGYQNAGNIYSGNVNWASTQANPWTTGISTGLNTATTLNNLGEFRPQSFAMPTGAQVSSLSGGAGPVSPSFAAGQAASGASAINAINTGSGFAF